MRRWADYIKSVVFFVALLVTCALMSHPEVHAWVQQPCNYFPLTIACGGTGATTAGGARTNLGAGAPIWAANAGSAQTSATTVYFGALGTVGTGSSTSELLIYNLIVPIATTFSNLNCQVNTTNGPGNSDTFTVRSSSTLGGVMGNSSITCTITNGTSCTDSTHTLALPAGSVIDYSDATTGTPNARTMACSLEANS